MKKTELYDYYGYIEEIIELNYNDQQTVQSVVLFKCYWYDQAKKGKKPRGDGHFTSINTEAQWYKEEPYVLGPQASKVLFLDDISNGKGWQVVQMFQPRHVYGVDEHERVNRVEGHQNDCVDHTRTQTGGGHQ